MYIKAKRNLAGPDVPPAIEGDVVEVAEARGAALIAAGFAEEAPEPKRGPAPPPLSSEEIHRLRGLVGGRA